MKKFKKTGRLFLTICIMFALTACSNHGENEFESLQGFEFHFYPEEYEEEYNEVSKSFVLEAETEYQLKVDAFCESGRMEIHVSYADGEDEIYMVDADTPCDKTIRIPANRGSELEVTTFIEPDTKGAVIGEVFLLKE